MAKVEEDTEIRSIAERKDAVSGKTMDEECKVKRGLRQIDRIAEEMRADAQELDEQHGIPVLHVDSLRRIGYPAWNVPKEYGGQGMPLTAWLAAQERLAQGNPSVALGIGWHMGIVHDLAEKRPWPESTFADISRRIVEEGGLINRAAMEVGGGSPSRGGKPRTTAQPLAQGGYVVNGRKTFTTFAPLLQWFIVTATVEGTNDVIDLIIPREAEGVSIEWTWNMTGMRGTASHDLLLDHVSVPDEARVMQHNQEDVRRPNPYLLHIPVCYLGIAVAARDEALSFATTYTPPSLQHPIAKTAHVERLLGEMEVDLIAARHLLYGVAKEWETKGSEQPTQRLTDLVAVKTFVVQTALSVVDKAMRIVGAHSLSMDHPLQRMYRDVRFGLHNPPMEDIALQQLARGAVHAWEQGKRGSTGE